MIGHYRFGVGRSFCKELEFCYPYSLQLTFHWARCDGVWLISTLRALRQKDHKFKASVVCIELKASLDYIDPVLKSNKQQ